MKRKFLITAAIFASLVLSFLGYVWYGFSTFESGINVPTTDLVWLPESASNVTYFQDWLSQYAEFDIEEKEFVEWCTLKGWPLQRVTEAQSEFRINRPRYPLEQHGVLKKTPLPPADYDPSTYEHPYFKKFKPGDLFYSRRYDNSGGYYIAYEVETGRAFYTHSNR